MSCKIAKPEAAEGSTPITWRSFGAAGPGQATAIRTLRTEPPAGDARQADALSARVRELEAMLQHKVAEAKAAGFQEGERAGKESAKAQEQATVDRLSRSLADVMTLRARVRRDSESELVMLSISIARRILNRELVADPDAIQGLVRTALDKVQTRECHRIRLHASHLVPVKALMDRLGAPNSIEIVPDSTLSPGDVILETSRGHLEASMETQLREIERGFADRLSKH